MLTDGQKECNEAVALVLDEANDTVILNRSVTNLSRERVALYGHCVCDAFKNGSRRMGLTELMTQPPLKPAAAEILHNGFYGAPSSGRLPAARTCRNTSKRDVSCRR